MRRRIIAALAAGAALSLLAAPVGAADGDGGTGTVTATVLAGTRSVTLPGGVDLTGAFGVTALTGTYLVTVDELDRSGTNPWSLQASIGDLTRVGGTEIVDNTGVKLTARDVAITGLLKVGTGADPAKDTTLADTPASPGNEFSDPTDDTATPQLLFRIINEEPDTAYTATYTGTGDISADITGLPAGTYEGTVTYTLNQ